MADIDAISTPSLIGTVVIVLAVVVAAILLVGNARRNRQRPALGEDELRQLYVDVAERLARELGAGIAISVTVAALSIQLLHAGAPRQILAGVFCSVAALCVAAVTVIYRINDGMGGGLVTTQELQRRVVFRQLAIVVVVLLLLSSVVLMIIGQSEVSQKTTIQYPSISCATFAAPGRATHAPGHRQCEMSSRQCSHRTCVGRWAQKDYNRW